MNKVYLVFLLSYVLLLVIMVCSVFIAIQMEARFVECNSDKVDMFNEVAAYADSECGCDVETHFLGPGFVLDSNFVFDFNRVN